MVCLTWRRRDRDLAVGRPACDAEPSPTAGDKTLNVADIQRWGGDSSRAIGHRNATLSLFAHRSTKDRIRRTAHGIAGLGPSRIYRGGNDLKEHLPRAIDGLIHAIEAVPTQARRPSACRFVAGCNRECG